MSRTTISLTIGTILAWAACGTSTVATEQFAPTQISQAKDGSWTASTAGGWEIQVFPSGKEFASFALSIEDAIPKDEYQQHVDESTAGPIWAEFSLSYILDLDGKAHYCVRTSWDRRILINLVDLKQAEPAHYVAELEKMERDTVLELLTKAVKRPVKKDCCMAPSVLAAAYVAGRANVHQAAPMLAKLESLPHIDMRGGSFFMEGLAEGDIHPFNYGVLTVRRVVQVSLRQLGEKPANHPATEFHYLQMEQSDAGEYLSPGERYKPKTYETTRQHRVKDVRKGQRVVEVLDALGPPDTLDFGRSTWQWDVDSDDPYTFEVQWTDRHTVRSVDVVAPSWRPVR